MTLVRSSGGKGGGGGGVEGGGGTLTAVSRASSFAHWLSERNRFLRMLPLQSKRKF